MPPQLVEAFVPGEYVEDGKRLFQVLGLSEDGEWYWLEHVGGEDDGDVEKVAVEAMRRLNRVLRTEAPWLTTP